MNINEIAKTLLDLREKRMTGYIMAGVVREALGFEGYGEALRRRWIEADTEQSGMLTVSNNLTVVEEIRKLAAEAQTCTCKGEKCDCGCKDGKCTCESVVPVKEDAHFLAQSHAYRAHNPVTEFTTLGLGRTGDTAGAQAPGLGVQSATPPPTASIRPPVAVTGQPGAPAGTGAPGSMSSNIMQAEAASQAKFGQPFAKLSPEQQAQIESDLQRAAPQAR